VGYHIKDREVVIAFRGAPDPSDWIQSNLQAMKIPPAYPFPGVSYGFVANEFGILYQDLKDCVLDAILELQQTRYQLVFTGHSLGGALAGLAALDVKINYLPEDRLSDIRVYTYGQPRVGNKAWAEAEYAKLGVKYQRMVNYDDCVPKLPKHELGYQHNAYEIFEYPVSEQNYRVCDHTGEDSNCMLSKDFDCTSHFTYMGIQCCGRP